MNLNDVKQMFASFSAETIADLEDAYHSDEARPDDLAWTKVIDAINYEVQHNDTLAPLLMKAYINGLNETPGLHTIKYREYKYPLGATYRLAIYDEDLTATVGDKVEVTYINEGMDQPKDFWLEVTNQTDDRLVGKIGELEVRLMNDNIKAKK